MLQQASIRNLKFNSPFSLTKPPSQAAPVLQLFVLTDFHFLAQHMPTSRSLNSGIQC
jgi:hypothetical protein